MLFPETFNEDPLRILRGVRFGIQLGFIIDPDTEKCMADGAGQLVSLSAERIQEEFTRLLTDCDQPGPAFILLRRLGALVHVLPELDRCAGVEQNEYHPHDVFEHSIRTCDQTPRHNLEVRWAALLHDVGKVDSKQTVCDEKLGERVVFYGHQLKSAELAVEILRRLRYSNVFIRRCENLIRFHMFSYESSWKDSTVRRFIRRVGEENLDNLFILCEADARSRDRQYDLDGLKDRIRQQFEQKNTLKLADLRVNGSDVIDECGVEAGPEIGLILSELMEAVLDDPALNKRETLLEILRRRRGRGA
jgi:poly(A) polymerase/tRNA nucleotidyltransferase (CCA-adding enzyme)